MKICKTYNGLLNSIEKGQSAILYYTGKSISPDGGAIVYLADGTNLILSVEGYDEIKNYLVLKN